MIEILIGTVIIIGTSVGLWCFGNWISGQSSYPVGFWANGKPMEDKTVSDIPGYNRAYGALIRKFSVPALCAGFLLFLSAWWDILAIVSVVVLLLWGSVGIICLILSYKKIENLYISR